MGCVMTSCHKLIPLRFLMEWSSRLGWSCGQREGKQTIASLRHSRGTGESSWIQAGAIIVVLFSWLRCSAPGNPVAVHSLMIDCFVRVSILSGPNLGSSTDRSPLRLARGTVRSLAFDGSPTSEFGRMEERRRGRAKKDGKSKEKRSLRL